MADSLKQLLTLFDIEAEVAYGSRPALVALQTANPEIVFLDINMPGVSGFEVLGYLKREPRLAEVPVIVVTSDDQPETAKRARDAGVSAMMIKPVTYEMLEATLKEVNLL
jgi:CheY-like chemotaxis protein